ncbi:Cof-type HAD-IIB family hydrolase [Paenibacillus thalictri]|uniref:Cof-type HAD-IIB family hydrolase n=1 Tax=Paenibacillus thalictri TaxID=2527873 RepID=A0A4V2J4Q2_9BACL|nr:Cof-type HAD-IIB family hydrolase [Paenibacillus thalictri]TBL80692.1 Cof-type HAD-IIB family hydrolase [Paenibacillus thalictri]
MNNNRLHREERFKDETAAGSATAHTDQAGRSGASREMTSASPVKAVSIDLDGTLFRSDKSISPRSRRALQRCLEEGIELIVATARPPRSIAILCPELPGMAHMVYYNGGLSVNKYTGEQERLSIDGALLKEVYDYIQTQEPASFFTAEKDNELFATRPLTPEESALFGMPPGVEQPLPLDIETFGRTGAVKILLPAFGSFDSFAETFGSRLNIIRTDGGTLVQLMHKMACKSTAVARLLNGMGISVRECMAFGDDYNDLALFRLVGYPVAMGNAVEDLKHAARRVTENNDNDGVAVVLEKLTMNSGADGERLLG